MKIVLYGSCQVSAISEMIYEMTSQNKLDADIQLDIQLEVIKNWVYILDKKSLPPSMFICDIFIYQPYNGSPEHIEYHTDTILPLIKAKKISIPFMCSYLHWPDNFADVRNKKTKELLFGQFPQQSIILSKYNYLEELMSDYNKDHYTTEQLETHANNLFKIIKKVEDSCDVKILDFIKYCTNEQLFHSAQHPSNKLLIHVVNQILDILNIKIITPVIIQKELLKDHIVFILPCVQRYFKLNIQQYKLNGYGLVTENEYLVKYFENINSN